jgi:hypothetical protein
MTRKEIAKNLEDAANQLAFEAGLLRAGESVAARAKIAKLFGELDEGLRAYGIFPPRE